MRSKLSIVIILTVLFYSCENKKETSGTASQIEVVKETVQPPPFSSDSAYTFIEKQVEIGPRVPNTAAHVEAGDFIVKKLEEFGADVIEQKFTMEAFDGTTLSLRNIIGSYNPDAKKRILLAAHWDTRPFADKDNENVDQPIDGANDGGSGVGVLLEFARIINNVPPSVGIDIILFDGEDYGEPNSFKVEVQREEVYWCLGSQYWSENPHVPGYSAYYGILLDMVGAKNAEFYKEGISMHFAPKIVEKVWNTAANMGHGNHFIPAKTGMITDDHVFINENAKIPTIDIIEYGPDREGIYFGDYHHTHEDNLEIISKETLQAVGETVLYVIYNE